MSSQSTQCLSSWLQQRVSENNWHWLQERLQRAHVERDLHISLGLIPRRLGRDDLNLTTQELADAANASDASWDPSDWSIDVAARILLLCTAAQSNEDSFGNLFKTICQTADLTESITFYKGIALYPFSEAADKQVGEGLRTNIRAVFESIAHRNPYPRIHFDENRWNHMVLKALFIDSTLAPIQGLDDRANSELARILCDYAHERWAASRPVTPELWRCVGPFATGTMVDDLRRAAESDVTLEHHAGTLALSQCPDKEAQSIVSQYPETAALIASSELSWDAVAERMSATH